MTRLALSVLVQDVIARGLDPISAGQAAGVEARVFSGSPPEPAGIDPMSRHLVFCSLPNATRIRRAQSRLSRGLLFPRHFLDHTVYTSLIDPETCLNPVGIYLPWVALPRLRPQIETLFGNAIFIRPASPMKPFPGFSVALHDLEEEHRLRQATDRVADDELCFIAPAWDLPDLEYRVWIVDAMPITAAAYSWTGTPDSREPVPGAVLEAAARLARRLELREQIYTADFILLEEKPRLVELNAMSTSGWYPGLDLAALFRALDRIMI